MSEELTKKQNEELEEVFSYREDCELTDDELIDLREMFNKPSRFKILRKIMRVNTDNERGILHTTLAMNAKEHDVKESHLRFYINTSADEIIKNQLLGMYNYVKGENQKDLKAEMIEKTKEEIKEKKRKENEKKAEEQNKRTIGENL